MANIIDVDLLPKSVPVWVKTHIRTLQYEVQRSEKSYERISKKLEKAQEDFQDLLDLVINIAAQDQPEVIKACQDMVERFNPGSYESEASS